MVAAADWNAGTFEVPDVIGWRDFRFSRIDVADELARSPEPGPLLLFPYPNGPQKLRRFSVAQPEDVVVLRAAAGRVIRRVELFLCRSLFSYRLRPGRGCWSFNRRREAWAEFTNAGIKQLTGRTPAVMCRTDVASYYPSVSLRRLQGLLYNYRCDRVAVRQIMRLLGEWNARIRGLGLPIGPEACAVLSNAYLAPVDDLFGRLGIPHLRYGDDILYFGDSRLGCEIALTALDEQLAALGLKRSAQKTRIFEDPIAAIASLKDPALSSLGHHMQTDEDDGAEAVHMAFDARLVGGGGQPGEFRWIVGALLRRNDLYGCRELARDRKLMNLDPRVSADYLGKGLKVPGVAEDLMRCLMMPCDERFEGLTLHLLRASCERKLGEVEAREFRRIAADSGRLWPVRNWAWHAYARTSGRYEELMEAAREEENPNVRRAIVVALRGHARRPFLKHARDNFLESRHAVRWLQAA